MSIFRYTCAVFVSCEVRCDVCCAVSGDVSCDVSRVDYFLYKIALFMTRSMISEVTCEVRSDPQESKYRLRRKCKMLIFPYTCAQS